MEHERRKLNGRLSCAVCRTEDERWSSSNGKPRNQFETASSIRFNIKPTDERGAHDGTRRGATRQQVLLFLKKKIKTLLIFGTATSLFGFFCSFSRRFSFISSATGPCWMTSPRPTGRAEEKANGNAANEKEDE